MPKFGPYQQRPGSEIVAFALAMGISTALNVITFAVVWEAITHPSTAGLSENATQVLTGWGGGMIGVLGAYVGYTFGKKREDGEGESPPTPPTRPPAPRPPASKPPEPKPPEPAHRQAETTNPYGSGPTGGQQ